jgi:hypothetical protein
MAGLGHNGGPSVDEGASWRRFCWAKARADLLPTLPIEVLRGRVRRAKELGLDYKTYAGVRATTGHDVVAFLFSSNALRLFGPLPHVSADRAAKLGAIVGADRIALAQAPLTTGQAAQALGANIDGCFAAPGLLERFGAARVILREAIGKRASDTVLLVGDTVLEAEWCVAARLAGYVPADRYFGTGPRVMP